MMVKVETAGRETETGKVTKTGHENAVSKPYMFI